MAYGTLIKRRHKSSSSNTTSDDRISDLPESLISNILSLMPTKDAVATSILSRGWRFRWTKVTSFEFDNSGSENQIRGDFADSVNSVLLNHCGESINKFLLRWEFSKFRPISLHTWASIAVARNVRVLSLSLKTVNTENRPREFYLPSLLYTSETLEALRLLGPFRVKPPNVVCLPKLAKMQLNEVIYESDEAVHKLISGCPALESLAIKRVNKRYNLVVCSISSPSLKYLFICFLDKSVVGDMKLRIDAPALEVIIILDHMSSHISIQQRLMSVKKVVFDAHRVAPALTVGLMKTFSSVNHGLVLHSIDMMPAKLSFERLAKLTVINTQWSIVMDLLDGCSIQLKDLGISRSGPGGDPWINPSHVPKCLSSLRRISFTSIDGYEKEMPMLKFFLDHCLALESVDICCDGDEAKRLEILTKVSKLSRASPACKVACLGFSAIMESSHRRLPLFVFK